MGWSASDLAFDASTELNNDEIDSFMQRFNIQCSSISPEAHWQMGKIQRHGKFLQEMLDKIDAVNPSIFQLSRISIGFEAIHPSAKHPKYKTWLLTGKSFFGKQSRIPGPILSDESIASHLNAIQETETVSQDDFPRHLQLREMARKAYHVADNSDSLRRAILRRSCPDRGHYQQGQWVMIWRTQGIRNPGWVGPQRVIIQHSNHTVWTTQGGKLFAVPLNMSEDHCLTKATQGGT